MVARWYTGVIIGKVKTNQWVTLEISSQDSTKDSTVAIDPLKDKDYKLLNSIVSRVTSCLYLATTRSDFFSLITAVHYR